MSNIMNFDGYDEKIYETEFIHCCKQGLYHCVKYFLNDGYIPKDNDIKVVCMNQNLNIMELFVDEGFITDFDKCLEWALSYYGTYTTDDTYLDFIKYLLQKGACFTFSSYLNYILGLRNDYIIYIFENSNIRDIIDKSYVKDLLLRKNLNTVLSLLGDNTFFNLLNQEDLFDIISKCDYEKFRLFINDIDHNDYPRLLTSLLDYNYMSETIKKVEYLTSQGINLTRQDIDILFRRPMIKNTITEFVESLSLQEDVKSYIANKIRERFNPDDFKDLLDTLEK